MASLFASVRGHLPRCTRLVQASVRCQSGFDNDPFNSPQGGGFGGPPAGGFGGPPQGGFGGPPQGGFGGPPQGGFGGPPQAQGGFGGPQGGFGGPPQGGFGGPPAGGFGGPQGGFGGPQGGFGSQGGFGGPPGSYSFRPVRPRAPIPDKEPFGLMLLRTGGLSEDDLLDLFKAHNPTKVKPFSDSQAHIYFDNREDLMAALALNGKEEVRFVRVVTSMFLHRLSKIPENGPFRVHLRNLPANVTQTEIMEMFKDYSPVDAVLLTSRMNQSRYAFLELPSKEMLMNVIEASGKEEVKGIVVNPTDSRE